MKFPEPIASQLKTHHRSEFFIPAPVQVGRRALVPVIEVSATLSADGKVGWVDISPLWVVSVERERESVLSITREAAELEELVEEFPDLAEKVEDARERVKKD